MNWRSFWGVIGMFVSVMISVLILVSYLDWITINIDNEFMAMILGMSPFILFFAVLISLDGEK